MIKQSLIALLMGAALSQPVYAKDIDGEFAVYGVGSKTCAAYLQARAKSGGLGPYVTWMEAYLSAFNLIVASTYNIAGGRDLDAMLKWTDQYCKDNPDELYVNAIAALTVALYPTRINLAPGKDNEQKWKTLTNE